MEVLVVVAIVAYFSLVGFLKCRRIYRRLARVGWVPRKRVGSIISGRAYVVDGDTIRVSRHLIRLAGLDAPEEDQLAVHRHGHVFKQGERIKYSLIRAIGGQQVQVTVEGYDIYGRVLGTVDCDGKDVGEWLVRNGYAVACFDDRYRHIEREARLARRGLWGHANSHHPAAWRRMSPPKPDQG